MSQEPHAQAAPRWTLRLTVAAALAGAILITVLGMDAILAEWPPQPSPLWSIAIAGIVLIGIAAIVSWGVDRVVRFLDDKAEDDRIRFGRFDRKLDVIAVGFQELGVEMREIKEVTTGEIPRLRNVLDRYDQGYADGLAGRAAANNGRVTPIKRQVP